MPTSPRAIAEVLQHKSYEFIKPSFVRLGIGSILGIGILLAEGDEHRVCDSQVGRAEKAKRQT